jgi:hypothetical protein
MVALGVDLGEISLRRLGVKIGARLPNGRLLQLVFGAQASECRGALLEHRVGMIGRRAHVTVVQAHQQLAGVNKFIVLHRHIGNETGDVRRDRRDVAADIGIIGALEKAIDGPPVVAVCRPTQSERAGKNTAELVACA